MSWGSRPAVYSTADRDSLHVHLADQGVHITRRRLQTAT